MERDLSRVIRGRVKGEGYEAGDERRKGETKEGRKEWKREEEVGKEAR